MEPHTDMTVSDTKPWYRQFWPWFIMAPPAVSVIAGLLTFYLAGAAPSMVVDDYGRIAMATRQRAEREKHAAELGLAARITFHDDVIRQRDGDPNDGRNAVTVTLSQVSADEPWPSRITLDLVHPTLSERDAAAILQGADGRYTGTLAHPQGRYYVSLSDSAGTWRLTGESWGNSNVLELKTESRTPTP
jgi:hypothetical protein